MYRSSQGAAARTANRVQARFAALTNLLTQRFAGLNPSWLGITTLGSDC